MKKQESTKNESKSNAVLNGMRAAVLGANDGIVSTSAVLMGVAGATHSKASIFTAGLAALVAGALSMAVGEYVSVSSQSDAEKAFIYKEKKSLKENPEEQFEDLVKAYEDQGLTAKTARQVASELTEGDPIKAHLRMEFGLDEDDVVSPFQAAWLSLISFSIGGIIPFVAIMLAPLDIMIPITIGAVVIALFITGYVSATIGNASRKRAVVRVIIGGVLAMLITYYVGSLFGTAVA